MHNKKVGIHISPDTHRRIVACCGLEAETMGSFFSRVLNPLLDDYIRVRMEQLARPHNATWLRTEPQIRKTVRAIKEMSR